ncbi:MAG: hypothetical protein NTZ67_07525 [Gammaproteobacteria bacterium]|nr:hypothetical protein [Gammaproteobacteria bacterium]
MNAISTTLTQTPWWAYLLLYVLIVMGVKALKTQVVSVKRLVVLPLVFIVLSVHSIITEFQLNTLSISIWLGSFVVGALIGFILVYRHKIVVDHEHWLVQLPGTWITLILILFIFSSKYYFSYEMDADPALVKQMSFEFSLLFAYGICTGLFTGRLACYLYRLKTQRSVDLSAKKTSGKLFW